MGRQAGAFDLTAYPELDALGERSPEETIRFEGEERRGEGIPLSSSRALEEDETSDASPWFRGASSSAMRQVEGETIEHTIDKDVPRVAEQEKTPNALLKGDLAGNGGDKKEVERRAEGRSISMHTLPRLSISAAEMGRASSLRPALDFSVTRMLGEGGMAYVYEAEQHALGRLVALKKSKARLSHSGQDLLQKEALVTGQLEHPNIVPVHLLGCDELGLPVMVMKRVEGVEWRSLLRERDHPTWKRWRRWSGNPLSRHLEILMDVANAVHFAHCRGIIHRDIKPSNVMIGEFGEVYLLDWGIAAKLPEDAKAANLTMAKELELRGSLVGTPSYMAPEMILGDAQALDKRTDVYLLGATLYEALAGHPPRRGATARDVLVQIFDPPPEDYHEETPSELRAICERAMQLDPEKRYPDAMAFREALENFLQHRSSINLSNRAEEILSQIESLMEQRGEAEQLQNTGSQRYEMLLHQRLTEARFACMAALGEWAENEAAKVGLQRCLSLMFEEAIRRRDAKSAALLLQEMEQDEPRLHEQLSKLQEEMLKEKERFHRLQRMEQELDLGMSSHQQRIFCAVMVVFGLFVGWFFVPRAELDPLKGHGGRFFLLLVHNLFSLGLLFLLRHSLLKNKIGRQFSGISIVATTAIGLLRALHWYLLLPAPMGLAHEALLFSLLFAIFALLFFKTLWVPSVAFLGLAIWQAQAKVWDPGILNRFLTVFWVYLWMASWWEDRRRMRQEG
jgi:serine/threonine-protein kinase